MGKRSNTRFANGVVSALIVCFFAVHGILGGLVLACGFATSPFAWVVWIGVGIVVLHVVLSIATSYQQMTDAEFPPSARKKRHLVLKWVTGSLLAATVCMHIVCIGNPDAFAVAPALPAIATVVLTAALAVHIWIGAKSLLVDVELSKGLMTPFRVVVCVVAIVIAAMVIAGFVT